MWSTIDIADCRSPTAIAVLKQAMDKYHKKNQDREKAMEVTNELAPAPRALGMGSTRGTMIACALEPTRRLVVAHDLELTWGRVVARQLEPGRGHVVARESEPSRGHVVARESEPSQGHVVAQEPDRLDK